MALCAPNGHCWPSVYLIGMPKAGSSFLWVAMQKARVCGATETRDSWALAPNFGHKEIGFFGNLIPDICTLACRCKFAYQASRYMATYNRQQCESSVFADGTPTFLDVRVPKVMMSIVPTAWHMYIKFIVAIREPIARFLSLYNYRVKAGAWKHFPCNNPLSALRVFKNHVNVPTFTSIMECSLLAWKRRIRNATTARAFYKSNVNDGEFAVSHGMYARVLQRWERHWSRTQMLVLSTYNLAQDPKEPIAAVFRFIGIAGDTPLPAPLPRRINEGTSPHHVTVIECTTRNKLSAIFMAENERLDRKLEYDHNYRLAPDNEPRFFPPMASLAQVDCVTHPLSRFNVTLSSRCVDWVPRINISTGETYGPRIANYERAERANARSSARNKFNVSNQALFYSKLSLPMQKFMKRAFSVNTSSC